jgi:DNA-binding transcriptional ArsR family regulator
VVTTVVGVERVGGLDTLARVGTALADGTRRRILVRLLDGPAYPAELADLLGTSRANVSNHLACLRGCGLVIAEREGRFVRYQVAHPDLAEALRLLAGVQLATEPGHADLDGRR